MYSYFMPTVNLMGAGAVAEVGNQVKILGGSKALVVTDKPLIGAGIVEKVTKYLDDSGVKYVIFDGVQPNPTVGNVDEGVALYKKENCDIIIAVGGGSPIDCAKGIGLVLTNGGSIKDYEGLDKSKNPMPPFIAVNTTAGTASEMTRFTIITDTDRHVKMAIVDWHVTPNVAINDPELMVSMPVSLTAATGMDALTHAVEAYVSTIATPVTDSAALKAIELIGQYLRPAVANGDNMEARDKMAYAEFLAGMAFNNASLGYVHAMAHQLGGFYDLPHGVCNAILLPHVQRFNMIACPERFVDIAKALGENVEGLSTIEAADVALEAIQRLSSDIGIPSGLKELGVKEEDLPTLADNAMKDACGLTNPRRATKEEIIQIFKNAM
ncbi:iron-containing alcohol dehydrogenase [Caldithrix abyssi DSM 13497]|uniref:Alcohol dehydrogenase n=1 Tax=Caldithrix abyssi DSM 13497 TaxID=880073 RepID=H1XT08_CALAY|nr:iron-containing alcohol dehydrogenase [Caldithrix abyssi]APF17320.1 alcohol dehydrogenase [Caldithrix abyssi DSM 13497]EHO41437.1 iron-containing alcohol dehydrogenase [Caldithrix abyssi DSM 13497]